MRLTVPTRRTAPLKRMKVGRAMPDVDDEPLDEDDGLQREGGERDGELVTMRAGWEPLDAEA